MSALDDLIAERKRIDDEIRRLTSEVVLNGRIKIFPRNRRWHLAILTDGCSTDSWKEVTQFQYKEEAETHVRNLINSLNDFLMVLEEDNKVIESEKSL